MIVLSNYYLQFSKKSIQLFNKKNIINEISIKSGIPMELENKILKYIESSKNLNSENVSRNELHKIFSELSFDIKHKV
jgi:hypothetical protein